MNDPSTSVSKVLQKPMPRRKVIMGLSSMMLALPVYRGRGDADTTSLADNVIKQSRLTRHILETERMEDGVLLAWKSLIIPV